MDVAVVELVDVAVVELVGLAVVELVDVAVVELVDVALVELVDISVVVVRPVREDEPVAVGMVAVLEYVTGLLVAKVDELLLTTGMGKSGGTPVGLDEQ